MAEKGSKWGENGLVFFYFGKKKMCFFKNKTYTVAAFSEMG